MAVKIRLARKGRKKLAYYHIVVAGRHGMADILKRSEYIIRSLTPPQSNSISTRPWVGCKMAQRPLKHAGLSCLTKVFLLKSTCSKA
jgi:hypothetical protein